MCKKQQDLQIYKFRPMAFINRPIIVRTQILVPRWFEIRQLRVNPKGLADWLNLLPKYAC